MADLELIQAARDVARAAAIDRWKRGEADTVQMLLSLDAALGAAVPVIAAQVREQEHRRLGYILGSFEEYGEGLRALSDPTASSVGTALINAARTFRANT